MITEEFTLQDAANKFVKDLLNLKSSERVLVYVDKKSNPLVSNEILSACRQNNAYAEILSLNGKTKQEAVNLLMDKIAGNFDILCELSAEYFYDTKVWDEARKKSLRLYCLGTIDDESFINCVGKVDHSLLYKFGMVLYDILCRTKRISIYTPNGTDMDFDITDNLILNIVSKLLEKPISRVWLPTGKVLSEGEATFMAGQLSIQGFYRSIKGKAVIDGYLWPPDDAGILDENITLEIAAGRVTKISGGIKAKNAKDRIDGRNTDVQHFCIGFNPGARLKDDLVECERIFGYITIGFGKTPFHTDGVIKNPAIYTDGKILLKDGLFRHEELIGIQEELLKDFKA